jgi:type III pantothenate kinase
MLCACDIGNSRIKAGLFADSELKELHYFSDIRSLVTAFRQQDIDEFAISSVVPSKQTKLADELRKNFACEPFVINHQKSFNLRLSYDSLRALGVDRVCSLEGAFFLYKRNHDYLPEREYILSIDFGTATTVNIVKPPSEFIGGIIAPGPKMMLRALQNHTAQLPKVNPEHYTTLIAQDTRSSMASGVITSTTGLIEKILNHLYVHQSARDLHIYITGGNAEYLIPHFDFEFTYEKALVLYGIKSIFEKNKLKAGLNGRFHE